MLYIYGEAHFQKESVDFIAKEIRRLKPIVLIHELLGDAVLSKPDVKAQLKICDGQQWCDPQTNKDIFELAASMGIVLFGCDLSEGDKLLNAKLSLAKQFEARERRMLEVMRTVPNTRFATVVAVVGDIHLRDKVVPELGAISAITLAVKSGRLKADIIRCDEKFREA
jgi:hypothetical protein